VLGNASITGTIIITVSANTPNTILLINATSLYVGNITIQVVSNEKCKKITAITQTIGNQLYALLSEESTCNNDNVLIIGISVGVGGFLLLILLLLIVLFIFHKLGMLPDLSKKEHEFNVPDYQL